MNHMNRLRESSCRPPRALAVGLVLIVAGTPVAAMAQDRGDCRGQQPTSWSLVVADEDEPGERLTVEGRVLAADGEVGLADVTVFMFQTDARGYYSPEGMDESNARLCGLVETDASGNYRFETIRPAHYATGGPPAHIHFRVRSQDLPEQSFTLNFEGDPKLGARGSDASSNPTWATIRPVEVAADGRLRVLRDLRVR